MIRNSSQWRSVLYLRLPQPLVASDCLTPTLMAAMLVPYAYPVHSYIKAVLVCFLLFLCPVICYTFHHYKNKAIFIRFLSKSKLTQMSKFNSLNSFSLPPVFSGRKAYNHNKYKNSLIFYPNSYILLMYLLLNRLRNHVLCIIVHKYWINVF